MSPKELSYIEDTLSHLDEVSALCQSVRNEVESDEFKALADRIGENHKQMYSRMMGLL